MTRQINVGGVKIGGGAPVSIQSMLNRPNTDVEGCLEQIEALRIKTPSAEQLVGNLSGGNQQKVVLAKWLANNCDVLILDEPTRGVDVGAKQEIYHLINELTEQGKAILVISSEMEELISITDRMLVLYEGKLMGKLEHAEYTQEKVLTLASGESL